MFNSPNKTIAYGAGGGGGIVGMSYFTTAGTWDKAVRETELGVKISRVIVEVLGAGGGGRRCDDSPYDGQAGGAGAYTKTILDASEVSSATITVGSGGGPGGNTINGQDGGFSRWDDGTTILTCDGGAGGRSGNGIKPPAAASGPYDFYIEGQPAIGYATGSDGSGGSTIYGAGGFCGGTYQPVLRGMGYGSGGAGARLNNAQPGANGIVIVTEIT